MFIAEYAHYLGVLIMSLNIQLSSYDFNISDIYSYIVLKASAFVLRYV